MNPRETLAEALKPPFNSEVLEGWAHTQRARGLKYSDLYRIAQRLVPNITPAEFDEAMQAADVTT